MKTPYDPTTVVLGVVGRPHGIGGELWLRPHNAHGRSFEGLSTLWLDKDGTRRTFTVTSLRPTPDGALVKLAGVDSRDAASALTLAEVRAPRSALPPLGPGEYYVSDVIGCAVTHVDGRPLGVVASTFWNGAHDVMIVENAEAEGDAREQLIPLVGQFVVTADVAGRKIVVDWNGHD
jgi:16S rRNA processing protein RimM